MTTGEIIGARGVQGLGGELPGHAHYGIQGPPGPQGEPGPAGPQGKPGEDYVLTPEDKNEIAEMAAELVEVPDSGGNVDQTSIEPAKMDRPKVFFGAPLQQTKDEIVTTFSYRSETLSFDCYAEIKAQGNSTLRWPKKNQTVKLYKDAACTEKFKVDFRGWGKQNKFVIKANWRDLTHVRDIVSVRLEGDCMRSNPDYEELPELLKTSPNLGGIDGFPVVVYAAGIYQGRYMWNIPKDKWMTNMDDELDEHCILCSEDYNSSCFRAAANINGNDWTDEIHDTVPASIKTRWNEIISFVMNSTDDEFVANLDSRIKVSTLIDRHIMGLYSCDYDGYGKNQLYITYDGQQWYAGRYDKDGTWGNYWTGNSMLPSNYGRNQYEDMISGRPGNLLIIRLEQLFYQRLQDRWEYLKVNELSIPNTIHRLRELYDITPPYVIEEDYASTTANGAFTEIPNKTTCTIQQIEKFVVERHAWMDEYMASLTPEVEVPCTGISLNTNTLTFTAEGSQTLTATVTPDGCTDEITWESDNTSIATVEGGVVTAVANGSATITAYCGEHSASCSVAVSGIEDDDVDNSLLYSLEEATTFDGVNDYIDTGIQLYDTKKDITLLIDFTQGEFLTSSRCVMHCMKESGGYPGMSLQMVGINKYTLDSVAVRSADVPISEGDRLRIVLKLDVNANKETLYINSATETSTADIYEFTAVTQNLLLGCYQDTSGNKGRFWNGTIHDCKVWNRVLTDDEIAALIGEGGGEEEPDEPDVPDETIPCTGITLSASELTFTAEGSQTLTATVMPSDTTDAIVWSSNNELVATVVNGVVAAKSNGSATITATCGSQAATCEVTVSGISTTAIDYTVDALASATWLEDYAVNSDSGGVAAKASHYVTEEIALQDCMYEFTHGDGNTYGSVSIYDADDNYIGHYEPVNALSKFYGNPVYKYRIQVYSTTASYENATFIPVDNSERAEYMVIDLTTLSWSTSGNMAEAILTAEQCDAIFNSDQCSAVIFLYKGSNSTAGIKKVAKSPDVFYTSVWDNTYYLHAPYFSTAEAAVEYFTENNTVIEFNKRYQ